MYIDNNWFLSLPSDISNPKLYTHTLGGQNIVQEDHLVLVWHKQQVKEMHWKDLGKTMELLALPKGSWTTMTTRSTMLTLFSGFDEKSWKDYYFFPKVHGEKLESLAASLWALSLVDKDKWWFQLNDWVSSENTDALHQLFILYHIAGKALIKWDSLLSIKIQLSLPVPFFSRKEIIDWLIHELQSVWYSIASYYSQQNNWWIYEITTNDYDILSYIQKHDKGLASVEKITTKELADQVRVLLMDQYPESKKIITSESKLKLFEVK